MATFTDAAALAAITLLANWAFLHKNHQFLSGIITIVIGTATYIVQADSNPFGIILVAIGAIQVFSAPWDSRQ